MVEFENRGTITTTLRGTRQPTAPLARATSSRKCVCVGGDGGVGLWVMGSAVRHKAVSVVTMMRQVPLPSVAGEACLFHE